VEQVRLAAHDLVELELLARLRTPDDPLPPELLEEAERLLGAAGPEPATRLGLPDRSPAEEIRAAAVDAIARWRDRAADPLVGRATADAAELVARSCETVLAEMSAAARPGAGGEQQG
jgi:hypothetical protein